MARLPGRARQQRAGSDLGSSSPDLLLSTHPGFKPDSPSGYQRTTNAPLDPTSPHSPPDREERMRAARNMERARILLTPLKRRETAPWKGVSREDSPGSQS